MKLFRIISVLALLAALALAAIYVALRASLPGERGELVIAALNEPVALRFDEWARPYVTASTLRDALAAEGYLHGTHRLWQMELLRRAGRGRLAEMLGEDLLATDRELWRVGVPALAQRLEINAGARLRQWVNSYVAGINAAIDAYPLLPPEFLLLRQGARHWEARDVFAVGALIAFQSGNNLERELLRLSLRDRVGSKRFALFTEDYSDRADFPYVIGREDSPSTDRTAIAPPPSGAAGDALQRLALLNPDRNPLMPRGAFGSNGWVVAPDKSASGHALHAFDSHDTLGLPNLFYEVHLFFGKGRQLRGWSLPGLPGVINGFNEAIAWGFTNIGDSQDLFLEIPSPEDPLLFRDGDAWYRAREETISIPVRGRSEPATVTIVHTRNGPLISDEPPLSLRWTTQSLQGRSLGAMLELSLARDWEAFNAAADDFPGPSLNATYADIAGNIGFRTAGLLPQRGHGNGLYPVRGDLPENRWQGMVANRDMPRLLNPAAGFIAAANARVNPPGRWPLISADNASPYRIQRLQDVLGAGDAFTLADMQALQLDWHDSQAEYLLPTLLELLDQGGGAPEAALLRDWLKQPKAAPDSAAALLFQQWYVELAGALFQEPLGDTLYRELMGESYMLNHALDTLLLTDRHTQWWPGEKATVVREALASASATLASQLGEDQTRWRLDALQSVGLSHELSRAEPRLSRLLDAPARPWGGSPATVGRAAYRYTEPFRVRMGATVRTVAEMKAGPEVLSVIPGGQSGHPLSEHYDDQFPAWLAGELYPIQATAGDAAPRLRLVPSR
ncbi:penicillin acylase family protein [Haliea sp.]